MPTGARTVVCLCVKSGSSDNHRHGNIEEETGDLIYKHNCTANIREEAKKAAYPTAAADDRRTNLQAQSYL